MKHHESWDKNYLVQNFNEFYTVSPRIRGGIPKASRWCHPWQYSRFAPGVRGGTSEGYRADPKWREMIRKPIKTKLIEHKQWEWICPYFLAVWWWCLWFPSDVKSVGNGDTIPPILSHILYRKHLAMVLWKFHDRHHRSLDLTLPQCMTLSRRIVLGAFVTQQVSGHVVLVGGYDQLAKDRKTWAVFGWQWQIASRGRNERRFRFLFIELLKASSFPVLLWGSCIWTLLQFSLSLRIWEFVAVGPEKDGLIGSDWVPARHP